MTGVKAERHLTGARVKRMSLPCTPVLQAVFKPNGESREGRGRVGQGLAVKNKGTERGTKEASDVKQNRDHSVSANHHLLLLCFSSTKKIFKPRTKVENCQMNK